MPQRPAPSLRRIARALRRGALRIALDPIVTTPGYWVATAAGVTWGVLAGSGPMRRRLRRAGGVLVAPSLPNWAFGRGGTMVGGVLLTSPALPLTPGVLAHEEAHRQQWRRYGLAFIPLYFAAGLDPLRNRFEMQAGLAEGGYLPGARQSDTVSRR